MQATALNLKKKFDFIAPYVIIMFGLLLMANRKITFAAEFLGRSKTEYVPVAQLDRVSDSDSEGRRFESFRVRQKASENRQFSEALSFHGVMLK